MRLADGFRRLFGGGRERRGLDFAVLLADRIARLPLGLLVAAAMARSLGPEAFGRLSHGLALVGVGIVLAQLGLDLVVVRRVAREPERAAVILGGACVARLLVGAVLLLAGGLVWAVCGGGGDDSVLVAVLALGVLSPVGGVPALWFQSRTRNRVAVTAGLLIFVAVSVLRVAMAARGASVVAFAWVAVAEWALVGLAVSWAMWREGGRVDLRGGTAELRGLLAEGWPLMVGALASVFYMKADILALRWLRGAEEAGVYAAATRLSELAYSVPGMLGMVFMASLSGGEKSDGAGRDGWADYFSASAGIGYLLTAPIILGGPWLIKGLFGEDYLEGAVVAQVHALSLFFLCLTVARGRVLVARGQGGFTMVSALAGAVVATALNLLLVPRWGAVGAAWATVAAHAIAGLGLTLLYPPSRTVGLALLRSLARPGFRGLR